MSKDSTDRFIIGIDPGTNIMGYGVIHQRGKQITLIELDVLKLAGLEDQQEKLKRIFNTVLALIDQYKPEILALEAPFFGKNVQSMLKLGRAQGVAFAAAVYRNVPVFEYSPRKIKQSITGRGAASKEQVAEMLMRLLDIKERPRHLDATDALAVAVCHYFQKDSADAKEKFSGWNAFIRQNPDRVE
ncbi:MAG: crossover junction endodeoxyribonuclease RuvC [Bacteroidales bacterium]